MVAHHLLELGYARELVEPPSLTTLVWRVSVEGVAQPTVSGSPRSDPTSASERSPLISKSNRGPMPRSHTTGSEESLDGQLKRIRCLSDDASMHSERPHGKRRLTFRGLVVT